MTACVGCHIIYILVHFEVNIFQPNPTQQIGKIAKTLSIPIYGYQDCCSIDLQSVYVVTGTVIAPRRSILLVHLATPACPTTSSLLHSRLVYATPHLSTYLRPPNHPCATDNRDSVYPTASDLQVSAARAATSHSECPAVLVSITFDASTEDCSSDAMLFLTIEEPPRDVKTYGGASSVALHGV